MLFILSAIAVIAATFFITYAIMSWLHTRKTSRRFILFIIIAIFTTLIATLLFANVVTTSSGIEQEITSTYSVSDPQFQRSMSNLLGPPIEGGNTIETLRNGKEIFPSMLQAIRSAKKTITFETYIYWQGRIGKEFADALSQRAAAGVKVHVLMDWLGSQKVDDKFLDEMSSAGVVIEMYHPLKWWTLDRMNHRTHRKLMVVDGVVGFTGGVGIADEWAGDAQDPDHWRDNHYRLTGPAVLQMQAAFMDNWMKTHASVLHDETYFPPEPTTGTMKAQVFKSGAEAGSSSARLMYLLSIACARKSVLIANSYFVPDDLSVKTLVEAAQRGVKIEIITPGPHIDTKLTKYASKAEWGKLLEAGIKIYEYQPTMYHCKYMVIDGIWSSVGSTNFDSRSFRLNEEANLNVLDAKFGKEQQQIFEADKKKSKLMTLEEWKKRTPYQKTMEWLASLLQSQV